METSSSVLVITVAVSLLAAGCVGAPSVEPPVPDGDEVATDAIAALEEVEAYSLTGWRNQTQRANNQQRSVNVSVEVAIERSPVAARVGQQQSAGGQSVQSTVYILDGIMYQRAPAVQRQFGAEWAKFELSGNTSDALRNIDDLRLHQVLLGNSTVTVNGTTTINGTEAIEAHLVGNGTAIVEYLTGGRDVALELPNVTATLWIDPETHRVLRATGRMVRRQTVRGQQLTTVTIFTEQFAYGQPSIDLPAAAADAVWANRTRGG